MTKKSTVSDLRPAMSNPQRPEWKSAKWVGALNLPAELAPSIQLVDASGYRIARLLVRYHWRPVAFVDVEIEEGKLDGAYVSELVSGLDLCLPSAADWLSPDSAPFITVVICTRDRAALLAGALTSVLACDYPSFEVVVVDNASADDSTIQYVNHLQDPRVTVLTEPTPGLSFARNTGVVAARGDVVAFTDDDVVVDAMWLQWFGRAVVNNPHVGCVTGLVPGGELRTPEQHWFDTQVSWSKNLSGETFEMHAPPAGNKLFPFQVGLYGTGANFAMPRSVIHELGGFDEALGVGSPTGAGEDIDMYLRVLVAGKSLVYEPAAIVWHRHRADMAGLVVQARGYGVGVGAWLTKVACDRELALMALRRLWSGLVHFRRITTPPQMDDFDVPSNLRRVQIFSHLLGPLAYIRSRRGGRRANPLAPSWQPI